jgi:hypothetical protein
MSWKIFGDFFVYGWDTSKPMEGPEYEAHCARVQHRFACIGDYVADNEDCTAMVIYDSEAKDIVYQYASSDYSFGERVHWLVYDGVDVERVQNPSESIVAICGPPPEGMTYGSFRL